jgi:hypothetical protein
MDFQSRWKKFVIHVTDDRFTYLRSHANAVAIPQESPEVILGPWPTKRTILYLQNLFQVSLDGPANVKTFGTNRLAF